MNESPAVASERVDDKPKRRQYTPEYKLRILQEIDSSRDCPLPRRVPWIEADNPAMDTLEVHASGHGPRDF
jgi:hypothetical protein